MIVPRPQNPTVPQPALLAAGTRSREPGNSPVAIALRFTCADYKSLFDYYSEQSIAHELVSILLRREMLRSRK